jgi:hypothetical protein
MRGGLLPEYRDRPASQRPQSAQTPRALLVPFRGLPAVLRNFLDRRYGVVLAAGPDTPPDSMLHTTDLTTATLHRYW